MNGKLKESNIWNNDKIEIYSVDEDLFKSVEKRFYQINYLKSIETIENEIGRYI